MVRELEPYGGAVTAKSSRSPWPPRPRTSAWEVKMPSFLESPVALCTRDEGQTMAEYGVVLAVITLAVVVALAALSGAVSDAINAVTGIF